MARAAIDSVAIMATTRATPTIRIRPAEEEAHDTGDESDRTSGVVLDSFGTPIR
jgi:hypothetical protein